MTVTVFPDALTACFSSSEMSLMRGRVETRNPGAVNAKDFIFRKMQILLVKLPTLSEVPRMANSPKFTVVLPPALLKHYRSEAKSEGRSVSNTICRALSRESGISLDPEANSKPKTRRLKGL